MRVEWISSVALLAGCDIVFRVDGIDLVSNDAAMQLGCEQVEHDEDRDGVLDACDRCPGVADDQADRDVDGVGDACDPSSTEANQLVLFETFAGDRNDWRVLDGTWKPDGESLAYESVSLETYGITLYEALVPEPPYVLEYRYTVESIQAEAAALAVLVDADPAGRGVSCGSQRHETPIRDVVRVVYTQGVISNELEIMTVTPGDYRVRMTYDRTQIGCSVVAESGLTSGTTMMGLPMSPVAGQLGFRSLRVGARIHHVAIYK